MITNTTGSTTLIRPDSGHSFYELSKELPQQAWAELLKRAPFVAAGIDTFTAVEKFAYQVLTDSGIEDEAARIAAAGR